MDTRATALTAALADRWSRPWSALGVPAPEGAFDDLVRRHAQPRRHYHGIGHVAQVIDWLAQEDADPELVIAGWFHDAVLVPGRKDNEQRSARLAVNVLRHAGVDTGRIERVEAAILATANHASTREDIVLLLDADLSILGAPSTEYRRYAAGVRREYARVPDLLYRSGRTRFLRQLLARPCIYRSAVGRRRHEAAARRNLGDECVALEHACTD
jgi:predicted metal-dependent HD superfamily phosphohydrolase